MTLSIIKPNGLTPAALTSTTAVDEYPNYVAGTSYNLNARVSYLGRIWECVEEPSLGKTPDANPLYWLNYSPSNRWRMFDSAVGTITSAVGELAVVIRPGAVGGIALLELVGGSVSIVMRDAPGGSVIYSKTVVLDGTEVNSFYDWFYAEYSQLGDVVLTDLPIHFVSNELTVTLIATSTIATVQCGVCHFGSVVTVGQAQYGATVGIIDYSKKSVDAFGNYSIQQRSFSKRADLQVVTEKVDFNRVFRALSTLRSTPCVYVGTEAPGYEPLIVYGFYKDFSIDVAYSQTHLCSLSLEGLI